MWYHRDATGAWSKWDWNDDDTEEVEVEQEAVATKAEVMEKPVKQPGQYVEGGWQDDDGRFHPSLDLVICFFCFWLFFAFVVHSFVCLFGWLVWFGLI